MPRTATIDRKTAETDVRVELNLDGSGHSQIATGVGFFDHMLTLLAKHAAIDLNVQAEGRSARRSAPHGGRRRHLLRPGA